MALFLIFFRYSEIAPTRSHIPVIPEYKDPKKLAEYLIYLDKNDDKYAEYFWWKPYYQVDDQTSERGKAYCDMCEALHLNNVKKESITKLHDWWTVKAQCKNVMKLR